MSIIQIQPIKTVNFTSASDNEKKNRAGGKCGVSPEAAIAALAAIGVTAAAILAVRAKKKPTIEQIKQMTGKNSHIANLTAEEKEKLIKELQAKTDDMDVKAEIRKLIENGEWDKL